MTTSPDICIACGTSPYEETRNGIPMKVCPSCKLFWRSEFDVDISYYEDKDIILDPEKIKARVRNVRDRANEIAAHVSLEDVCDIGCGEGLFLHEVQKKGVGHVVGVEPGIEAAAYAQKLGYTVVTKTVNEMEEVSSTYGPFKMYTMFHVIEHLPNPVEVVRSLVSLLPPGGSLVIETPDFDSASFTKRDYMHKHIYPEHLFYWNPKALARVLENEGLLIRQNSHRDFDQYHTDYREALRRLGILPYPKNVTSPVVRGEHNPTRPIASESGVKRSVRRMLSLLLSALIVLTGKGEYLWVIAQVPSEK